MAETKPTLPEGCKPTELGPLPEEWEVVRLGEIANLHLGRTPARKEARFWEHGVVPWVSIADLNNRVISRTKETISEAAFDEIFQSQAVPAGTLLLSFKLTIGKVGILQMDATHNEAIASIIPKARQASRDFLFYLLQSIDYDAFLDNYVKGRTLNKRKLNAFLLSPPTPRTTSHRPRAPHRTAGQRSHRESHRRRAGTQAEPDAPPLHLRPRARGGGRVGAAQGNRDRPGTGALGFSPILRTSRDYERASRSYKRAIQENAPRRTRKYRVWEWQDVADKNSRRFRSHKWEILVLYWHVLYSKIRPYLAKVALPSFIGICSADMYPVRPMGDSLTREFLFYYLLGERFTAQAVSFQDRTGIPKINRSQLGVTLLPVPPLPEQQEISRILSAVDEKISTEENRKRTLEMLFKTLLHHLMTGKLRVGVEPSER